MSHYRYTLAGDDLKKKKARTITAKTEKAAWEQITSKHLDLKVNSFEEVPNLSPKPKSSTTPLPGKTQPIKVATAKIPQAKVLSKLKNMLFLQHGKCFFCGEVLAEKEASIEHLNPLSKGGSKTEDNEVVCHKSLNGTFGNMDLKRKFEFTLKAAKAFKCPK